MVTVYRESKGGILIEDKTDHYEQVLKNIKAKGYCTRMVLTFNKPLTVLEFATVAEHVPDANQSSEVGWIQGLSVPVDNELSPEDQMYVIDLVEQGEMYPDHLDFLELRAKAEKKDGDNEPLYMYLIAYGFPYSH